ncbi:MAG: hypothetical protein R2849_19435 [Thermomicrobiales bacterium]
MIAMFSRNIGCRVFGRVAHPGDLLRAMAEPDTDLQPSIGQMVQGADFLGQPDRMVEGQRVSEDTQPDIRRRGRERCQQQPW